MIVDDSAVIRGVETRILEAEPDIKVVASVSNAQLALNQLARTPVDVMILDIEMPVLDGLSALPQIRRIAPQTKVIMASTLTTRGGEISLEALRLGAIDFVPKPTVGSIFTADDFKRELVNKVTALGRVRLPGAPAPLAHGPAARAPLPALPAISSPPPKLRPAPGTVPTIIGIGSSTGGPQALQTTLTALPASMQLPIVIVQHMPPTFTRLLADQIARATGRPTCEGENGMAVVPGRIYVAPGGMHMCIERQDGRGIIRLNNNPPENFCRPAVDPLFRSLAAAYGSSTLVLVLTGMGSDGARGTEAVAQAGGTVLAQDEATSVVWGMPGAAAATGVVSALIPLGEIGHRLGDYAAGKAR
ncbi:MAG TPA: chemotaxis response regulator protein-glutamate methylesterase [Stellaceae bacterium]|jgi:two-component system chemotaxis response regulator CheB|nr:chemotaxis response regulator protein-glutamate methylesterase [Stellaceae bacterium]